MVFGIALLLVGARVIAADDKEGRARSGDAGCFDELTFGRAWGGNNGTEAHKDYTGEVLTPRSVCDAARTVTGADEALDRLRRKLGECERDLTIVALGGSVSCGRNTERTRSDHLCPEQDRLYECKEQSFPALLGQAIATRRQALCGGGGDGGDGGDGGGGIGTVRVMNHCRSAAGSNFFVSWIASSPDAFHNADLVVVETSTNDVHETLRDHKERFGNTVQGGEMNITSQVQGWTELLARMLLALPSRPALVWAAAAWRDWEPDKEPPYHYCAVDMHRPVLAHYAIPQLSMLKVVGDMNELAVRTWQEQVICKNR